MTRGYTIRCNRPDCKWEQFHHTQTACNKAWDKHRRAKHPTATAMPAAPTAQLQLGLTLAERPKP